MKDQWACRRVANYDCVFVNGREVFFNEIPCLNEFRVVCVWEQRPPNGVTLGF